MSIKAVDLNFVYGGGTAFEQHALFDVNLEIEDGEFVGLIGHTGSGKSTLIQHLNGLIKASAGELYYNGENIYSQGYDMKQLRSKVGLVFQYPEHQLFEVDVLTDVCFGPKNQGLSREEAEARAKKALEQVGLDPSYYKQSPFELSGGMQQRVGIAAAMLLRPRVLLLPLATTVGTFAGAALASITLAYSLSECLAVGSGFAYYSLSSIFITQYKGAELGTVALLANIMRELATLLFTPLMVRWISPLAAISCGGASTMDSTLPVITRFAGKQWVFVSIVHAMILDFSVPFWVTFFCTL